ncbi:MAG: molybdenum cofactor biosynthesis protein MoaB [Thermoplasmata archaeon]|nr:molybdenum cofactor biosynthesis protein MoaB [Thermoplasmata archaeon]
MGHEDHHAHSLTGVRCAVLTVSDTRSAEEDTSGRAIVELLEEAGHSPVHVGVVRDDLHAIRSRVWDILQDDAYQAIVIDGGTGVSDRDVTIEAVEPLIEKCLTGFGELFRMLSYEQIGSGAIMSRALAGVANRKAVFCIPGSEKACKLAVSKLIAPELGHIIWEVNR